MNSIWIKWKHAFSASRDKIQLLCRLHILLQKQNNLIISCHNIKWMKIKVQGVRYRFIMSHKLHNTSNFQFQKIWCLAFSWNNEYSYFIGFGSLRCFLNLFRMGLFRGAHGGGGEGQKGPHSLKSVTHILQCWSLA